MSRDRTFIGIFVAVVLLILGGISFAIGNYIGVPDQVSEATIYDIDYKPAHTSTSGTGEDRKTKRVPAKWRVYVRLPDGRTDYTSSGFKPPNWQQAGARVMVTYRVGRWAKAVSISKIEKWGY